MDLLALDSRRGAKTSACVPAPSARTGQHARVNVCVRARALRAQRALATGPFASPTPTASPSLPDRGRPWWRKGGGLPRSTIFSSNCLICIRSRFITVLPGNRTVSFHSALSRFPFSTLTFLYSPPLSILAPIFPIPSTLNAFLRVWPWSPPTRMGINIASRWWRDVCEIGDLEERERER